MTDVYELVILNMDKCTLLNMYHVNKLYYKYSLNYNFIRSIRGKPSKLPLNIILRKPLRSSNMVMNITTHEMTTVGLAQSFLHSGRWIHTDVFCIDWVNKSVSRAYINFKSTTHDYSEYNLAT